MTKQELDIFFVANERRIINYARKIIGGKYREFDYRELCHDTYIKLYNYTKKHSQRSIEDISKMLYVVIQSIYLNRYRCNSRLLECEVPSELLVERGMSNKDTERDFILSSTMLRFENAINKIRPEGREIIEICCIKDFSYKDAATILGIKLGTVKSRLFRAKRDVRKHMERTHNACRN